MSSNKNQDTQYNSILSGELLFQKSVTPMMMVDSSRTIIKANQKFCELFRYTLDEMLGKKTIMLTPTETHFYQYAEAFEHTRDGSIKGGDLLLYKKSDNELFWVNLTGIPIKTDEEDFILWFFVDITEEVESKESLRRKNKELEIIFNRTNVGLMFVVNGVIQRVNDTLLNFINRDKNIVGQFIDNVLPCFNSCKKDNKEIVKKFHTKDGDEVLVNREIIEVDKDCYLVVLSDITHHVKEKESLTLLADMDGLTRIFNRRAFINMAKQTTSDPQYNNVCFAMLDIDYFKAINDTWGHDIGDHVLVELTELIQNQLCPDDTLGRLGGEEFGLLLISEQKEAIMTCQRIITMVEAHLFTSKKINITLSIGLVDCTSFQSQEFSTMYKAADELLYRAKNTGRNQLEY